MHFDPLEGQSLQWRVEARWRWCRRCYRELEEERVVPCKTLACFEVADGDKLLPDVRHGVVSLRSGEAGIVDRVAHMLWTRLVDKGYRDPVSERPRQLCILGALEKNQLHGHEAALAALAQAVEVNPKLKPVAGQPGAEHGAGRVAVRAVALVAAGTRVLLQQPPELAVCLGDHFIIACRQRSRSQRGQGCFSGSHRHLVSKAKAVLVAWSTWSVKCLRQWLSRSPLHVQLCHPLLQLLQSVSQLILDRRSLRAMVFESQVQSLEGCIDLIQLVAQHVPLTLDLLQVAPVRSESRDYQPPVLLPVLLVCLQLRSRALEIAAKVRHPAPRCSVGLSTAIGRSRRSVVGRWIAVGTTAAERIYRHHALVALPQVVPEVTNAEGYGAALFLVGAPHLELRRLVLNGCVFNKLST